MIYLELFLHFFKIGAFTFGGGYAMLPLIQETVLNKGWLGEQQLVNFIAVSESTPGPFAVNISTYIGMQTGGLLGAVCATLGVVLPSFIIILIVAHFYRKFKEIKIVNGCMDGLRPAVVGLIGTAILSVGRNVFMVTDLLQKDNLIALLIFGVASILAYKKLHPIWIILTSGVLGILAGLVSNAI